MRISLLYSASFRINFFSLLYPFLNSSTQPSPLWTLSVTASSPLLETMLQATCYLLSSIGMLALMSHYTDLALRPEWAATLTQTRPIIFGGRWRSLLQWTAVWMCSCACEQMYVVSVVVWTGHRKRTQFAVCFLPSFSPRPLLCSAFPSFQHSSLKLAVTWPLWSCSWFLTEDVRQDDKANGCPLWSIFNHVD